MANAFATYSVGKSLVNFLKTAYAVQREITQPFDFRLISSGELAESAEPARNSLTFFLYRITQSADLRNSGTPASRTVTVPPLALELHFLLTAWADDALTEQTVLTWAMQQMHQHPVLDTATLSKEADWNPTGAVQLVPEEVGLEDMSRIWDSLSPKYRLSVGYIARVVRIDTLR